MKETFVKSNLKLDEIIKNLENAKNICVLGGSEEDSWRNLAAWDPADIFNSNNDDRPDALDVFINENKANNRLSVGYVSYDYGYKLRGVRKTKSNSFKLPAIIFYSFENYVERTDEGYKVIYKNTDFLQQFMSALSASRNIASEEKISFEATLRIEGYAKLFNKTKEYIKKGHVYQLNLTHALEASSNIDSRSIFSNLYSNSLGKMMGYFEGSGFEILSASPERFIRTNGNHIETFPIKGTRARQGDDEKAIASLIANEKELSELNMITDLLRNDLGEICEPGSIRVEKQRDIQKLSNLFHTYSKIAGRLNSETTPINALLSMFPGGSITGCPKKRAMEIIDELEPETRGIYCGCMVVIDRNGDLDSNILIRTIVKKGDKLVLPVGGGIVFDSKLEDEYQETLSKATSLQKVLS